MRGPLFSGGKAQCFGTSLSYANRVEQLLLSSQALRPLGWNTFVLVWQSQSLGLLQAPRCVSLCLHIACANATVCVLALFKSLELTRSYFS